MKTKNESTQRLLNNGSTVSNSRTIITLAAILLLASVLRLLQLGSESLTYDEFIMLELTRGEFGPLLSSVLWGRPPVLPFLGYGWVRLLGPTEETIRLLSVLFGIGGVYLIFRVGKQLFNQRTGLIAAFLMSVSAFHIYYSQDYRYYSLLTFITLLAVSAYLKALQSGQWRHFILSALAAIVVYYTHTHGVFVLFALGVHFLIQWRVKRDMRPQWIVSQLIILLGLAPGILLLVTHYLPGEVHGTFAPAVYLELRGVGKGVYVALIRYLFFDLSRHDILPWLLLGAGLAACLLFIPRRRSETSNWPTRWMALWQNRSAIITHQFSLTLLTLWFFCPLLLPLLLSQLGTPMFSARYTIAALPAFYLLGATAIDSVRSVVPTRLLLLTLLPAILFSLVHFYTTDQRDQWDELAASVAAEAEANDAYLFVAINNEPAHRVEDAFEYYYPTDVSSCGDGSMLEPTAQQATLLLERCAKSRQRLWLISRPILARHESTLFSTFKLESNDIFVLQRTITHKRAAAYLLLPKVIATHTVPNKITSSRSARDEPVAR